MSASSMDRPRGIRPYQRGAAIPPDAVGEELAYWQASARLYLQFTGGLLKEADYRQQQSVLDRQYRVAEPS